jgi:hypothetical protein
MDGLGDQLASGAALALDQHRYFQIGGPLRQPQRPLHFRRDGDDVAPGQLSLGLALEPCHLLLQYADL